MQIQLKTECVKLRVIITNSMTRNKTMANSEEIEIDHQEAQDIEEEVETIENIEDVEAEAEAVSE